MKTRNKKFYTIKLLFFLIFSFLFIVDTRETIKLSTLKKAHINELKAMLDVDSSALKNWKDLAEKLLEGFPHKQRVMNNLELNYAGGGSPGETFLSILNWQQPDLTKEKFIELCKPHRRNDIVKVLRECGDNKSDTSLWGIPEESRKDIESKLNFDDFWELLADDFDFDSQAKEKIRNSIKDGNSSSPTEGLFVFLSQYRPDLGLMEVAKECRKMSINNVAGKLEEIALILNAKKKTANT